MKKSILVTFIIGALSLGAFAQNANQKTPRERYAQGNRFTAEERAEMRTKRMEGNLGLSKEQYQKVLAINLEQEKKIDDFQAKRKAEMEANREKFKTERDAQIKKYEAVLTPEQMTKMRDEQKNRRGEMQGKQKRGGRGRN